MAILAKDEIIKRLKTGTIKIEPLDKKRIGPASIDLTLDNKFRIFKRTSEIIHLSDSNPNINKVSEVITVDDFYVLRSGQTIHGITREKITLPKNICGWIQGRSRFARLGLMVHITASFIQPGVSNRQVLEMNNAGPMPIAIYPGIAICQVILEETKGTSRYTGRFKNQKAP